METVSIDFGPILHNKFGEYYLPTINREIFSQVGADSFYRRHFGDSLGEEDSLYIIVGTDSGRLVHWIISNGWMEGSRYLFIEYPDLLNRLQTETDLPDEMPENVRICDLKDWVSQAESLALKDYFYLDNVRVIKSLAVVDVFFEGYQEVWNDFEEQFGQYRLSVNQEIGSQVFMVKGLENLAENRFPATCLQTIFEGKTAVLLAGGPSLKESYAWVRKHRKNLAVLALARIADQLKKEDIIPDFFFAIDPHDVIFHQSKGMLSFWKEALLVNVYHLNPKLLSQWRGRSVYMGSLFSWEAEMNQPGITFPGITVGHQALGMAIEMGFSQVVVSGFDLCFSKEGFTHAEGSTEREVGPYTAASELMVETNGGWMAETRYDFFNSIPSFAYLAKVGKDRGCQIINPAPGAVKIEEVDHLSWESLMVESMSQPAWDTIVSALPEDTRETRQQHNEGVLKELNRMREEVRKVMRLVTEAIECNDKLFGRKGRPPDYKFKKRMDIIEKILDEEYSVTSKLVKRWGVGAFLKLSRPDKKKEWTDKEIEEAGRRYYEIYRENAVGLTKLLDEMRQRLRARMEEDKPKPNFNVLISQWTKDNVPGRLYPFLDRQGRKPSDFIDKIKDQLSKLEEQYQAVINETITDYTAFCVNDLATPQAVRAKVLSLFKQKQKQRLKDLGEGLRQGSSELKDQYGFLIKGLLFELDNDPPQALRAFRQITSPLFITDALQRIFSITLQEGDIFSAVAISKRLSERSPLHIPYYGDLLRMTGEKESAIKIYTDYAKLVKNDLVTLLKLGKLHKELGRLQEARTVFEDILKVDPDNKAARLFLAEFSDLVTQ